MPVFGARAQRVTVMALGFYNGTAEGELLLRCGRDPNRNSSNRRYVVLRKIKTRLFFPQLQFSENLITDQCNYATSQNRFKNIYI